MSRAQLDTSLLCCIRGVRVKIVKAKARERQRRPLRFAVISVIRIVSELGNVPLRRLSGPAIYLPSLPAPNAKSGYVRDELLAAGLPQGNFHHAQASDSKALVRLARLLVRLPWALFMLGYLVKRSRRLDRVGLQITLGREAFRRWLRRSPNVYPVIISDVSPARHMLWSAAAKEGNRAIWWQDDFHHHRPLPYRTRAAAVLNEPGLQVAKAHGVSLLTQRPTHPPRKVKKIPAKPTIGIAVNARFMANPTQKNLIFHLCQALDVDELALRLHPTSRLSPAVFNDCPVRVAASDESLTDYANRMDLAVVGNSAIQLWLLRAGVPVVHIQGLDEQGYDRYGYVGKGIVYGCESIDEMTLSAIRTFYDSTAAAFDKLARYTSIQASNRVAGLGALGDLMECSGR